MVAVDLDVVDVLVANRAGAPADLTLARRGLASERIDERAISVDGANGTAQEALEALRAEGIAVRSFELLRPTLEDVFLEVVRGERHS